MAGRAGRVSQLVNHRGVGACRWSQRPSRKSARRWTSAVELASPSCAPGSPSQPSPPNPRWVAARCRTCSRGSQPRWPASRPTGRAVDSSARAVTRTVGDSQDHRPDRARSSPSESTRSRPEIALLTLPISRPCRRSGQCSASRTATSSSVFNERQQHRRPASTIRGIPTRGRHDARSDARARVYGVARGARGREHYVGPWSVLCHWSSRLSSRLLEQSQPPRTSVQR